MSEDRTEQEYHLTPNGWVAGSFFVYADKTEDGPVPPDRVETWIEEVLDTSRYSPQIVAWKQIWKSPTVSAEVKADLDRKFPRPEFKLREKYRKPKRRIPQDW
jgi:hypothetical protein